MYHRRIVFFMTMTKFLVLECQSHVHFPLARLQSHKTCIWMTKIIVSTVLEYMLPDSLHFIGQPTQSLALLISSTADDVRVDASWTRQPSLSLTDNFTDGVTSLRR